MLFKRFFFLSILTAVIPVWCEAQSVTEMPLVLQLPGMDRVEKQTFIYKTINDTALKIDIYHPPDFKNNSTLPVVIFNNGVGSMTLPDWRGYTDWAKLVALQDLIAVHYQSRRHKAKKDSEDLINYLRANSEHLGVDADRMGIWTSSANVYAGLPLAMDSEREYIRCAVVYYGSARIDSLRQGLPLLIVRAGLDSYSLNRNIDRFVVTALNQDIQLQLINYLHGQHGFDVLDNTDRSREIIRQTLDFLKFNLTGTFPSNDGFIFTAKNFYTMVVQGKVDQAKDLYREAYKKYRQASSFNRYMNRATAEASLNSIGYQLLDEDRPETAVEIFELMIEFFPDSPNACDSMADGYEAMGKTELAIDYSEKALKMLDKVEIRESLEQAIRESANKRLKRLREGQQN